MTDARDSFDALAEEARSAARRIAAEPRDGSRADVVELHQIARRGGERVQEATPARHPLAAFRGGLRHRVHGVALMLLGGAGVSTGLLVVGGSVATIVGAGVGVYGLYLCRR
jgi:hypothetical protein